VSTDIISQYRTQMSMSAYRLYFALIIFSLFFNGVAKGAADCLANFY